MGERYETMAEIEKRYDGEWVLIDRPTSERGRPDTVTGGVVVMHTPDRAELDRRLLALKPGEMPHFAALYIGRLPDEEEWTVEPSEAEPAA
jgi:hypothetical protein